MTEVLEGVGVCADSYCDGNGRVGKDGNIFFSVDEGALRAVEEGGKEDIGSEGGEEGI